VSGGAMNILFPGFYDYGSPFISQI